MLYTIGVDGGGTKTEAVMIDESGTVHHRIVTGATNPHAVTFEIAEQRLAELIDLFLDLPNIQADSVKVICLGLAGVSRPDETMRIQEFIEQYLRKRESLSKVHVRNDAEIALMAALNLPHGLIAISGTGSIVYGVASDGNQYRVGGWGHLLGDQGSGYAIGLQALQAAMQSYDGILPETMLTSLILAKTGLRSIEDMKRYIYQPTIQKQHIADFASVCIQAGEAKDAAAIRILERSAEELAIAALTIRHKHPSFHSAAIAISGSLFVNSLIFRQTFEQRHRQDAPQAEIVLNERSPAIGAAYLGFALKK
jgi:N-acetylglucosamine kinase-like BadF-type ATPase